MSDVIRGGISGHIKAGNTYQWLPPCLINKLRPRAAVVNQDSIRQLKLLTLIEQTGEHEG